MKHFINSNNSDWIYISTQNGSTYVPATANAGQLRWNPGMNCLEVCNGPGWVQVAADQTQITVTQRMVDVLTWAEKQMRLDQEAREKIDNNPTVADAYENYCKATEQLKIVMALTDPS